MNRLFITALAALTLSGCAADHFTSYTSADEVKTYSNATLISCAVNGSIEGKGYTVIDNDKLCQSEAAKRVQAGTLSPTEMQLGVANAENETRREMEAASEEAAQQRTTNAVLFLCATRIGGC